MNRTGTLVWTASSAAYHWTAPTGASIVKRPCGSTTLRICGWPSSSSATMCALSWAPVTTPFTRATFVRTSG